MCTLRGSKIFESPDVFKAIQETNEALEGKGLYMTHIFDEDGLVHTNDWISRLAPPPDTAPKFTNFKYDAVSPEDIIISKITRFDEKDKQDIALLMQTNSISKEEINKLIPDVSVPQLWEEA